MAEPLTFKFVFADESAASGAPPPDAAPGAATTRPLAPSDTAPAPRPAPSPKASPATPSPSTPRATPASVEEDAGRPSPRNPRSKEPAAPRREEKAPEAGEAKRAFTDLLRHLGSLPVIGGGLASLAHVIEPLLQARERITALNERRRAADERETREAEAKADKGKPTSTRPTPKPRPAAVEEAPPQSPAPRTAAPGSAPAAATPAPAPRPPDDKPDERSPAGTVKNPTPGTAAAAMEKLIAALGPLPEGQKELAATLKPLTALGYTLKELVAAVRAMREAEKAARSGGASSPAPRPVPSPAPSSGGSSPAPRPPKPGPATITPRDVRPTPGDAIPVPAPGAAAAGAADAGLADAAAGGATAAGALGGPAGIVAAVAVVAVVGAATRAFSGLVDATKKLDARFVEASNRLAPFNGHLAYAQAQAQARQVITDTQSANQIGNRLADFTSARSDATRAMQRIGDALSGVALDKIVPLLQLGANIAEKIGDKSEAIETILSTAFDALVPQFAMLLKIAQAVNAANKKKLPAAGADIMEIFFGAGNGRLQVEGIDFGPINNPLMPRPIRRGPQNRQPKRGNQGPAAGGGGGF